MLVQIFHEILKFWGSQYNKENIFIPKNIEVISVVNEIQQRFESLSKIKKATLSDFVSME